MKAIAILLGLTIQLGFTQHVHELCKGFAPENDMNIPIEMGPETANAPEQKGGITADQFNEVIDQVEKVYGPIVAEKGGVLKVVRKWDDGTVNAYAQRQGDTYIVTMFGGLARHWATSRDAFATVVCHELGHHIGGIPTKGGHWASSEGQSDYFASLKCMRTLIKNEASMKMMNGGGSTPTTKEPLKEVPVFVKKSCLSNFEEGTEDYTICLRGSLAGYNLANLLNSLSNAKRFKNPGASAGKKLDFETPNKNVVTKSDPNHPQAQCRLDTYFQGALCHVDEREDVSYEDETVGVCARVTGDKVGIRPLCWFKPKASLSSAM